MLQGGSVLDKFQEQQGNHRRQRAEEGSSYGALEKAVKRILAFNLRREGTRRFGAEHTI